MCRQGRTKAEIVQVPWITFISGDNHPGFQNKNYYYQGFCKAQPSNLNSQTPLATLSPARAFRDFASNSSDTPDAVTVPDAEKNSNSSINNSNDNYSSMEGRGLQGVSFQGSPAGRMRRREVVPPGFLTPIENPLEAPAVNDLKAPGKPAATRLSSLDYEFPVRLQLAHHWLTPKGVSVQDPRPKLHSVHTGGAATL